MHLTINYPDKLKIQKSIGDVAYMAADCNHDGVIDEADVEPEDTTPEQNAKVDIFEMIISFIKSIFEMLFAFIPVPIK